MHSRVPRSRTRAFFSITATLSFVILASLHRSKLVPPQRVATQMPHSVTKTGLQRVLREQKAILAPLTRGGNLPFRKMVAGYGANVSYGEMIFARMLVKGDKIERARLRAAPNEKYYGVQIACKSIDEGLKAGNLAKEAGATWLDINCGCPIYEATRRGLGAVLIQRPAKLQRLIKGLVDELDPFPVSVKIRTGKDDDSINVAQVVEACGEAGAACVTVHGRTQQQRYSKRANWSLIKEAVEVANRYDMPVVGNGDVLTYYEAERFQELSGCASVMIGRGALIKPWIFYECQHRTTLNPTAKERVKIYRELVSHMKDHFKDDDRGKRSAFYFLPWHFNFFCRYRPLVDERFHDLSLDHPLIQSSRGISTILQEQEEELEPLEKLLRLDDEEAHLDISSILWDAASDDEAVRKMIGLAESDEMKLWESNLATKRDSSRSEQRGRNEEKTDKAHHYRDVNIERG